MSVQNKELQKKLNALECEMTIESRKGDLKRARAVTVGTCFGGTTELMMRGNDGSVLWTPMQPVEVIELIHQLAANVGCHINLKPRDDFSSWREWRVSDAEKLHLSGHPPFVNDMALIQGLGSQGFNQAEAERIMIEDLQQKEYEYVNGAAQRKESKNESAVATKKTINKRSTKRTTKAT